VADVKEELGYVWARQLINEMKKSCFYEE